MINTKMGAFLLVGFIAGSFVASPELRAFAANTVGSADIINNSIQSVDIKDGDVKAVDLGGNAVTSAKIKNGEVKSEDIANDAVGAREFKGVDKLIFADCNIPALGVLYGPGSYATYSCKVAGIDSEDEVIVMANTAGCFAIVAADTESSSYVKITFLNTCDASSSLRASHLSIIVYDELPDKVPPG